MGRIPIGQTIGNAVASDITPSSDEEPTPNDVRMNQDPNAPLSEVGMQIQQNAANAVANMQPETITPPSFDPSQLVPMTLPDLSNFGNDAISSGPIDTHEGLGGDAPPYLTPGQKDLLGIVLQGALNQALGNNQASGNPTDGSSANNSANTDAATPAAGSIDMRHGYQPPTNPQTGSPAAAAYNVTQSAVDPPNSYQGYCAEWVINELNEAGYNIPMTDAQFAGPNLEAAGFNSVGSQQESPGNRDTYPDGYAPQSGDVVVEVGEGHQHIAIYNGTNWVSDTVQPTHFDPYPNSTVNATFYRHP